MQSEVDVLLGEKGHSVQRREEIESAGFRAPAKAFKTAKNN